jgi:hypothetical protein
MAYAVSGTYGNPFCKCERKFEQEKATADRNDQAKSIILSDELRNFSALRTCVAARNYRPS